MGITQELLKNDEYQEFKNNDTLSAELSKFESSLDISKVTQSIITELTKEERDKLNPQDQKEHISLKVEQILKEYIEYRKKGTLQVFLQQTEGYLSDLKTQGELQGEQAEVLKENHYSYFDLVKNNTTLYNQIATQISASSKKTLNSEQEKEKAVKERCDSIEGVWISYISGSLDVTLPPETLQSMATGFALKLTAWLNTSGNDAGEIARSTNGMTEGGLGAAIPKLFNVFKNISGFAEIMSTVNNAVKAINTHGTQINTILASKDPTSEKIALEKIFNTPQGFYDWLNGSLAIKNPNNTDCTFEMSFVQFKGNSDRKSIAENVIGKLNYTPGVHALMDKVIHEGKGVLDLRNDAKDQVDVVFDQVQSLLDSTGGLLGNSVTEALESIGLKGVADFVYLLLGYGSVSGMEKKYRSKKLDKELTTVEKGSLNSVVAYAKKYMGDTSIYGPTTHDDSASFLKRINLKDTIDKNNSTQDAKTIDLTVFPTSPDLVVDSFIAGFDKGAVPDPTILSSISTLQGYTTTSNDKDGNPITIIDPAKEQELHTKLKNSSIVQQIVATVAGRYTDPMFLAEFSAHKPNEAPKDPSDYISLLYTTCVAPANAMKAREFDAIDRSKIGQGIVIEGPVGLGAQKAQELANEAQKKRKEEEEKKDTQSKEDEKKKSQTELDQVNKEIGENSGKDVSNLSQEEKDKLKNKARELGTKKAELEAKIAELENPSHTSTYPPEPTTPLPTPAADIPAASLSAPAADKTGTDELNINKALINLDGAKSITQIEATQHYGSSAAVRNFNPGNIIDTTFGGQKVSGERFTRFNTPKDGLIALIKKIQNIQAGNSKTYGQNPTLSTYLHKYAPPSENNTKNYIQFVCQETGANADTPLKDIDTSKLVIAHIQKEDGKCYKMLKELGLIQENAAPT